MHDVLFNFHISASPSDFLLLLISDFILLWLENILWVFFSFIYLFFYLKMYWFWHTLTWIRHGCRRVPHPEPLSHLPPHPIPMGHPSAPAPSTLYLASNLDWRFVSHMIMYMSQCHSPVSPHTPPSPTESKRLFYTSVSLLLSHIQGYGYHLSKFHIYASVYCIGVFLSGLLHSV